MKSIELYADDERFTQSSIDVSTVDGLHVIEFRHDGTSFYLYKDDIEKLQEFLTNNKL